MELLVIQNLGTIMSIVVFFLVILQLRMYWAVVEASLEEIMLVPTTLFIFQTAFIRGESYLMCPLLKSVE